MEDLAYIGDAKVFDDHTDLLTRTRPKQIFLSIRRGFQEIGDRCKRTFLDNIRALFLQSVSSSSCEKSSMFVVAVQLSRQFSVFIS